MNLWVIQQEDQNKSVQYQLTALGVSYFGIFIVIDRLLAFRQIKIDSLYDINQILLDYKLDMQIQVVADFVIVGTGPVGATFARKIREHSKDAKIIMIDAGSQYSKLPGQNAKNFYIYNRDEDGLDLLSHMVKAQMINVSKTPSNSYPEYLPPSSITYSSCNYGRNLSNPNQKPEYAMPSAASSFQVGGMGGHWTCCTPRPYQKERINQLLISTSQMDQLLQQSEKIYHTTQEVFKESKRGKAVLNILQQYFAENKQLVDPNRPPAMLPLAVQKFPNQNTVYWTGVDTILGNDLIKQWVYSQYFKEKASNFTILPQTLALKLHFTEANGSKQINSVQVKNLNTGAIRHIKGKKFIVCGNAFYTPQLLHYSKIRPKALGKYLNEHSMMFCQVVLKNQIIQQIEKEKRQNPSDICSATDYKMFCDCKDPFPILENDPIPNVWIPHSQKFQFHVQLHRDAFPYSTLPENTGIDHRVILDIRFFCKTEATRTNQIVFQQEDEQGNVKYYDLYGLPQLSIHFERSINDSLLIDKGMKHMEQIANRLGGYLKGSQPQLLPRGQSLHFMGTTRIGNDQQTSTCDVNSLVWGTSNLYVGGNGNIPSQTACNPTLTSSALAIKAVKSMFAVTS